MSGALNYVLGLEASGFVGGMEKARAKAGEVGMAMEGMASRASGGLGGVMAVVTNPLLLGGMVALAGAATAAGVAMGGVRFLKGAFDEASKMETTRVAMEVLVGSAEKTRRVMGELTELGAKTPLETGELMDAARKLLAFGEGADTVTETLRRVGDVSTGVTAPIGEIAEIFGKARVQGTLFAEDINQLVGRGIPVIGEFAKMLGVSEGEVKKLASDGAITFPLLEQAFINLTSAGGKFFGMMEAQSHTSAGLMSTLADGWDGLKRAVGEPLNDALKPVLEWAIAKMDALTEGVRSFITLAKEAYGNGDLAGFLVNAMVLAAKSGVNVFAGGIRSVVAYVEGAFGVVLRSFAEAKLFDFAAIGEGLKTAMTAAAATFVSYVMDGLAGVMPFQGMKEAAARQAQHAGEMWAEAGEKLTGKVKLAEGLEKTAKMIGEAHDVGMAAAGMAGANVAPMFDTSKEKGVLDGIATKIPLGEGLLAAMMKIVTGGTASIEGEKKAGSGKADGLEGALAKVKNLAKPVEEHEKAVRAETAAREENVRAIGEETGRRRAKLYDGAESVGRRWERMSAFDKKRYGGSLESYLKKNPMERNAAADVLRRRDGVSGLETTGDVARRGVGRTLEGLSKFLPGGGVLGALAKRAGGGDGYDAEAVAKRIGEVGRREPREVARARREQARGHERRAAVENAVVRGGERGSGAGGGLSGGCEKFLQSIDGRLAGIVRV